MVPMICVSRCVRRISYLLLFHLHHPADCRPKEREALDFRMVGRSVCCLKMDKAIILVAVKERKNKK